MARLICILSILMILVTGSCKEIRGPRGLKQSEWILQCVDNPDFPLCQSVPLSWPADSVYLSALIFQPDLLQEYRCDTAAGGIRCEWFHLVQSDEELDIRRDTIFIKSGDDMTGLWGYRLEDGLFIIESVNSSISAAVPGSVFRNVDQIPENYPGILEAP